MGARPVGGECGSKSRLSSRANGMKSGRRKDTLDRTAVLVGASCDLVPVLLKFYVLLLTSSEKPPTSSEFSRSGKADSIS